MDPDPDPTQDRTPFCIDFKDANKKMCLHVFLITCTQAHSLEYKKLNFLLKFGVQILFSRHYFTLLNTFMRKGKDPEPDPEPDPDPHV
jgi:hypothetical protein